MSATGGTIGWARIVTGAVGRLRARYIGLLVLIALSCAASVFALLLGSYAQQQTSQDAQATVALREIVVYPARSMLTEQAMTEIGHVPGVTSVSPFVRLTAGLRLTGSDLSLIATTDAVRPPIVAGEFSTALDGRGTPGIVLPAAVDGFDLRDLVGRDIDLTVTVALDEGVGTTRDVTFHVTGASDPSYQVDGPAAAYAASDIVLPLYLDRLGVGAEGVDALGGYEKATVLAASADEVESVTQALQDRGYQAVSRAQELAALPGTIVLIRTVGGLVAAMLLVISAVGGAMLVSALARQRTVELGVLRAVGWTPLRVLRLWASELGLVVLAGVVTGTALGLGLGVTVGTAVRDSVAEGQLGPVTPGLLHLLVPVAFLVVTLLAAWASVARHASRDVVRVIRSLS